MSTISTQCSECGKIINNVPVEYLSKKAKCPKCKKAFTITEYEVPAAQIDPVEEYDDYTVIDWIKDVYKYVKLPFIFILSYFVKFLILLKKLMNCYWQWRTSKNEEYKEYIYANTKPIRLNDYPADYFDQQDPPTEKQLRFAKKLNITIPKGSGKYDVSDLIDDALAEKRLEAELTHSEPQNIYIQSSTSGGVAAVLSLFIPGLGQLYKGQIFNGLVWFITVGVGYMFFIVPGLILHLLCIIGASSVKNKYEVIKQ